MLTQFLWKASLHIQHLYLRRRGRNGKIQSFTCCVYVVFMQLKRPENYISLFILSLAHCIAVYYILVWPFSLFLPPSDSRIYESGEWKRHFVQQTVFSVVPVVTLVLSSNRGPTQPSPRPIWWFAAQNKNITIRICFCLSQHHELKMTRNTSESCVKSHTWMCYMAWYVWLIYNCLKFRDVWLSPKR